MTIDTSNASKEFKTALTGFASLLGSSVISALGFVIIASNRFVEIESATAVFIILFVQWQTLGLTIAKTGIEQVVFAVVTENEAAYLNPAKYVFSKAVPLSAIFSVAVFFVFTHWAAFVAFCTIILDTYSLIITADLNARKKFSITSLSNLLNYPLFFVLLFSINFYGNLSINVTLSIFLLSSVMRFVWLKCNQIVPLHMTEVCCNVNFSMGIQQGLNYLMFRADQVVLAVLGVTVQLKNDIAMYVFLAKFPELLSGILVIAGTVLFPRYYIKYPFDQKMIFSWLRNKISVILVYISMLALALYMYTYLWSGRMFPFYLMIPFVVHSLCIIVANNITYSSLRQGYLRRLLSNLAISLVAGLSLTLLACLKFTIIYLAWIVPLQLMVFIALTFSLKWGRQVGLHV